ncbi:MAG: hypothetical protein WCY12_00340 [Candidatus Omnitrophota bacterium]
MRLLDIEKKARAMGIKNTCLFSKGQLIRLIQKQEGNNACFGTLGRKSCPQMGCCWRPDCVTTRA